MLRWRVHSRSRRAPPLTPVIPTASASSAVACDPTLRKQEGDEKVDTGFDVHRSRAASALVAELLDSGSRRDPNGLTERQFWVFASPQPLAEKPWTTFMGRQISVPDMPEDSQKRLGLFDRQGPGCI